MLKVDRNHLLKISVEQLKKQRKTLLLLSFLLFITGIACLLRPQLYGDILSITVGALLAIGGVIMILAMFVNRERNRSAVISGLVFGAAYIIMGYSFIRAPEVGIFALAVLFATLFCLGGIIRLVTAYRLRKSQGVLLPMIIGILDLVIAWIFISATPQMSVTLVTTVVGIELILSAISCLFIAKMFPRN